MVTIDLSQQFAMLPPVFEHQLVTFVFPAPATANLRLTLGGELLEPFLRPGEASWYWRWNPGAAVGSFSLHLLVGSQEQSTTIQVLPAKIDQEHYALLLEDLRWTAHALVLQLGSGFEGAAPSLQQRHVLLLTSYYALFEEPFERFQQAVKRIARQPRERLQPATHQTDLGQARMIDITRPPSPELLPPVAGAAGPVLPGRVSERTARVNYDSYEHRLLRRTIELLIQRAQQLERLALLESQRQGNQQAEHARIQAGCASCLRRLRELAALPFLADVGALSGYHGPTPLLQRDADYRAVLRMWLTIRRSPQLTLDQPPLFLPIAELPRLYEYWCALQAFQVALAVFGIPQSQTVLPEADQSTRLMQLEPGQLASFRASEWQIGLFYQPHYRPARNPQPGQVCSADRHTRIPDLVFEAQDSNRRMRLLVFEVKYRLASDGLHMPLDALAEAYAYRGALSSASVQIDHVLVLYPGLGEPEVYSSGVGALPLLPGGAHQPLEAIVRAWVAELE